MYRIDDPGLHINTEPSLKLRDFAKKPWFCTLINGEVETRHGYPSAGGRRYVEVDCETGTMVYKGGL